MSDNLKLLSEKLEELKNEAKEEMNYHFDNSSDYPCEYNRADLEQKRYDTICEILLMVNSFCERTDKQE